MQNNFEKTNKIKKLMSENENFEPAHSNNHSNKMHFHWYFD